ncbi:hypothetical protein J6590_096532 [Homalodisca vitripennis]|nr:hypothetical protein J6590_096532 [Homalodisca vitripennis]
MRVCRLPSRPSSFSWTLSTSQIYEYVCTQPGQRDATRAGDRGTAGMEWSRCPHTQYRGRVAARRGLYSKSSAQS